ncbi:hypothetical protein DFJ73DRAFT_320313 [Zopfochytrium polystomum]|nr:hypothetical protein DFJ73DRAFT_320313 [Zopfochytrium polystomum]
MTNDPPPHHFATSAESAFGMEGGGGGSIARGGGAVGVGSGAIVPAEEGLHYGVGARPPSPPLPAVFRSAAMHILDGCGHGDFAAQDPQKVALAKTLVDQTKDLADRYRLALDTAVGIHLRSVLWPVITELIPLAETVENPATFSLGWKSISSLAPCAEPEDSPTAVPLFANLCRAAVRHLESIAANVKPRRLLAICVFYSTHLNSFCTVAPALCDQPDFFYSISNLLIQMCQQALALEFHHKSECDKLLEVVRSSMESLLSHASLSTLQKRAFAEACLFPWRQHQHDAEVHSSPTATTTPRAPSSGTVLVSLALVLRSCHDPALCASLVESWSADRNPCLHLDDAIGSEAALQTPMFGHALWDELVVQLTTFVVAADAAGAPVEQWWIRTFLRTESVLARMLLYEVLCVLSDEEGKSGGWQPLQLAWFVRHRFFDCETLTMAIDAWTGPQSRDGSAAKLPIAPSLPDPATDAELDRYLHDMMPLAPSPKFSNLCLLLWNHFLGLLESAPDPDPSSPAAATAAAIAATVETYVAFRLPLQCLARLAGQLAPAQGECVANAVASLLEWTLPAAIEPAEKWAATAASGGGAGVAGAKGVTGISVYRAVQALLELTNAIMPCMSAEHRDHVVRVLATWFESGATYYPRALARHVSDSAKAARAV